MIARIKTSAQLTCETQTSPQTPLGRLRQYWPDLLILVTLFTTAIFLVYQGSRLINTAILDRKAFDVWFDADLYRVFSNMTDRGSDHYRTRVHPIFSLIAFPPVSLLAQGLDLGPVAAVRAVIAIVAALWSATLFTLLRLLGCLRADAVLFSLLANVSASAVFWFIVPETYQFGSLSILLALGFVALTEYRQFSSLWYIGISALTLSVTTTNWMAGILLTAVSLSKKKALQVTINAFCLVVLLWGVQKALFSSAEFFLGVKEEKKYIAPFDPAGPIHAFKSFVAHTIVMPSIDVTENMRRVSRWPMLSIQASVPGSGSAWGAIAVVAWTALLGLGIWGFFAYRRHTKLRIVLALTLLGQLLLHAVYGTETFLYSLHFLPLLILLAAFSTFTRARPVALLLTAILVVTAGTNNFIQLNKTAEIVDANAPQRYQVLHQMQQRPTDPWPRGSGHVVLAEPGILEADKAYYEPAGSFSPSVGSFGVSLWLSDESGNLQLTSDSIPEDEINQRLTWKEDSAVPGVIADTPYYQTEWSMDSSKDWRLRLTTEQRKSEEENANPKQALSPQLAIRSVGPAGGPINNLSWDGQQLLINQRWRVTPSPLPARVSLGTESQKDWVSETSDISSWEGQNGWGYARLALAESTDWNFTLHDTFQDTIQVTLDSSETSSAEPALPEISAADTRTTVDIDLPNQEFAASLKAQVAHLMMGLVGDETRPGEPTNYPLAWQRDGAYTVVSLARAGNLQAAKALSADFAENDFFGGFGAEADAPGLSIWALEEVAIRLKQPAYDQYIWPHVQRKAEFILEMMTTASPIYKPFVGPVVPKHEEKPGAYLVAEPSEDGLIVGRMDWQRPLLFINAVSYRGLLNAADLADRLNQVESAQRWREAAAQLQTAWENAFLNSAEADNNRTYISALWPTWIGENQKDAIAQQLENRWEKRRDVSGNFKKTPLWTYFDLAEAHQWLFVDQPERLWTTLQWFWNHQSSPGLYTWWEGDSEENTFNHWENIRGWVTPPNVTPHYWTSAEMLLMQLDMLAYSDLSADQPTIVIGAGILPDWLEKPMSVSGLSMPNGKLDWRWDGQKMQVTIASKNTGKSASEQVDEEMKVKLGAVFPTGTPLEVVYSPS